MHYTAGAGGCAGLAFNEAMPLGRWTVCADTALRFRLDTMPPGATCNQCACRRLVEDVGTRQRSGAHEQECQYAVAMPSRANVNTGVLALLQVLLKSSGCQFNDSSLCSSLVSCMTQHHTRRSVQSMLASCSKHAPAVLRRCMVIYDTASATSERQSPCRLCVLTAAIVHGHASLRSALRTVQTRSCLSHCTQPHGPGEAALEAMLLEAALLDGGACHARVGCHQHRTSCLTSDGAPLACCAWPGATR